MIGVCVLSLAFTALSSQYMQLIVTHAECDFSHVCRSKHLKAARYYILLFYPMYVSTEKPTALSSGVTSLHSPP